MTASDHRPRAALRRRLRPRPLTPHTGTQPAAKHSVALVLATHDQAVAEQMEPDAYRRDFDAGAEMHMRDALTLIGDGSTDQPA